MVTHVSGTPWSCFLVRHEQARNLLYIEWQPLVSAAPAREMLQQLLTAIDTRHAVRWLVNLHGMPALSLSDQHWLEQHYLPQLVRLPLQYMALILTSHRQHEDLLDVTAHFPPPFEVQVFDDLTTALEWLHYVGAPAVPEAVRHFHAA
ncbi:SpoIIAA family protein [Hymenobacter swuensis]|uniref:STAS/SEC14 domain-containing protein n=1 Tax=Hymenobacter swuensis DY53 TaxID=1227739 RepID=W8EVU9_9BACT|nr:STAS/SEC14 domain-containing protein [Hymenobacter swuensis]AHJ95857.1 hypothetical protein Hsw_0262 [Hymenobacter swuensis DY53]